MTNRMQSGRSHQCHSWVSLALALTLISGHYAGLQILAWTGMIVARVQTRTVSDAVKSTFDGSEPCRLCMAVTAMKAADEQAGDPARLPEKPAKPSAKESLPELMLGRDWNLPCVARLSGPRLATTALAIPASAVIGVDPPPPRC